MSSAPTMILNMHIRFSFTTDLYLLLQMLSNQVVCDSSINTHVCNSRLLVMHKQMPNGVILCTTHVGCMNICSFYYYLEVKLNCACHCMFCHSCTYPPYLPIQ